MLYACYTLRVAPCYCKSLHQTHDIDHALSVNKMLTSCPLIMSHGKGKLISMKSKYDGGPGKIKVVSFLGCFRRNAYITRYLYIYNTFSYAPLLIYLSHTFFKRRCLYICNIFFFTMCYISYFDMRYGL